MPPVDFFQQINGYQSEWKADMDVLSEAYHCWKQGSYQTGVAFRIAVQSGWPEDRPICVAGFSQFADLIARYSWSDNEIFYLGSIRGTDGRSLFDEGFLNYLQRFRFSCTIDAVGAGTVVSAGMPVVKMEGPRIQVLLTAPILIRMLNKHSSEKDWIETDNR